MALLQLRSSSPLLSYYHQEKWNRTNLPAEENAELLIRELLIRADFAGLSGYAASGPEKIQNSESKYLFENKWIDYNVFDILTSLQPFGRVAMFSEK